MDDQPFQYGLYPYIVLGNISVANEAAKLFDNPGPTGVGRCNVRTDIASILATKEID